MIRLSALFVAICMVLIAGALGIALYLVFGIGVAEAAVVALTALTGLAVYNVLAIRTRYQGELSSQIADLSRGTADLARQVGEQGRRLAALEKSADHSAQRALAATQPIHAELGELGLLVNQLAQTVASQDASIRAITALHPLEGEGASFELSDDMAATPAETPFIPVPLPSVSRALEKIAEGPFQGNTADEAAALVREAVAQNRLDLYLQPIVTLPQRKVRLYEATPRLRTADDKIIAPQHFGPFAELAGCMPAIDNFMFARCVRIVRRLQSKNRDVGVICNLSIATLADPEAFAPIADFAEANRVVATALAFALPYPALRELGAHEEASLARLTELGFRLAIDHITDLRFDARDLAERKCGFLKLPAAVLLNNAVHATANIHPADLAGLLGRYGIELIADGIVTESTVVDLLDFELKLAEGDLFSPPRPARPEATQLGDEREDADLHAPGSPSSLPSAPPFVSPRATPSAAERTSAVAKLARGAGRQ